MNDNEFNHICDEILPPRNINQPHLPVVFALDRSSSMYGLPIQSLNASMKRFVADVCKDPRAADIIDVEIISFNSEPKIEQTFRPISQFEPTPLVAEGGTNLSIALELAVNELRERCHLYADQGIEIRMPHLILISDGYGGNVDSIAEVIKQRTADKKMQLWVLAIKGYDKETIAKLTDGIRVFELVNEDGYDFTDFFKFLSESFIEVSTAAAGQRRMVENPLTKKDTNLQVPDFDKWLNE